MSVDQLLSADPVIDDLRGDEVVFRPIRSGNLFDETVGRLLEAIKLGALIPGERFPSERDLVKRLGVSRPTLREAMRVLAQAGYVQSRRGRNGGTFVLPRTSEASARVARRIARDMEPGLRDLIVFRRVLEPSAAAFAAERAGTMDLEPVRERLARMAGSEGEEYRAADSRFHVAIAELAGSQSLALAVADTQVRLADLFSALPLVSDTLRRANVHEHVAILGAIEQGDADAARYLMSAHIESTATLLLALLD